MLCNSVGGQSEFAPCCEILDCITAGLSLLRSNSDNEWHLHFIGLAYLVADAFAGKVHCNIYILSTQFLGEAHGVRKRRGLHDTEHQFCRGGICRQKIVRLQKIARGYVSHPESNGRNRLTAKKREQVVVPSSAEDGPPEIGRAHV